MKKITVLLFLMGLFACTGNQGVSWTGGSFADALDIAKQSNKPILVDFYSDT